MVLTNAELFEILNAEIDRVNEASAVNKAHREVSVHCNIYSNNNFIHFSYILCV